MDANLLQRTKLGRRLLEFAEQVRDYRLGPVSAGWPEDGLLWLGSRCWKGDTEPVNGPASRGRSQGRPDVGRGGAMGCGPPLVTERGHPGCLPPHNHYAGRKL
jgi:hypothetical protein